MKKIIVFIFTFIFLFTSLSGCKNPAEEKDANTEFTLKVGTYNIERGNEINWDFTPIAEDIIKFDLDLVGFQEVDECTIDLDRRSPMRELAEMTGLRYYHFTNVTAWHPGYLGNCFISRYPIVSVEDFMFDTGDNYYKRGYCHAVLNVNGNLVHYYNTHLTHDDKDMMMEQEDILREVSKDHPRYILTADWNDWFFNFCKVFNDSTIVNTPETTYLTYAGAKKDDGSFSGKSPIDNIIASNNATILNAGVYNTVYHSDHFLLYCTLHFSKI